MGRRPPTQLRGSAGFETGFPSTGCDAEVTRGTARSQHARRDRVRLVILMGKITLITGGARSRQESASVEAGRCRINASFSSRTGEALDDEMTARIEFHRTTRPPDFQTVEEPIQVVAELEKCANSADLVVIDCLTLWMSNLMHRHGTGRWTGSRGGGQARGGAEGRYVREYRRDRRSWIGNRADRSRRVAPVSAICSDGPIRKSRRSRTRCC